MILALHARHKSRAGAVEHLQHLPLDAVQQVAHELLALRLLRVRIPRHHGKSVHGSLHGRGHLGAVEPLTHLRLDGHQGGSRARPSTAQRLQQRSGALGRGWRRLWRWRCELFPGCRGAILLVPDADPIAGDVKAFWRRFSQWGLRQWLQLVGCVPAVEPGLGGCLGGLDLICVASGGARKRALPVRHSCDGLQPRLAGGAAAAQHGGVQQEVLDAVRGRHRDGERVGAGHGRQEHGRGLRVGTELERAPIEPRVAGTHLTLCYVDDANALGQ
mmetsp:Transcript_30853/g.77458  ORF Transcript_30853/g.77458 Transcript_30853/m.77458 type:complete len:273 (-) Transcript_30853:813-1631(-)